MKKLLCLAALTAILSIGVTAFAEDTETFTFPAEYVGGTSDSASVDATGYSAVIIEKDEDNGEIVYIDQADDVYTVAKTFLLKADPKIGKYKVTLGSKTSEAYQTYFYVGVDSTNNDKAMTRLQGEEQTEDGYNIGYYAVVSSDDAQTYKSLKVGYKNQPKFGGFDLSDTLNETVFSGASSLYLIFQLNDVPSDWKDSVTVFLSPDQVSGTPVQ